MGHAYPARRRSVVENLETRILFAIPNDPLFDSDGRFTNVNAPAAWDITTGSSVTAPGRGDLVVAIIDSGLDLTHPDIAPNLFVNDVEVPGDGLDNDNNGFVDDINGWDFFNNDNVPDDIDGHGTHVAGIVGAAGNNGVGTTGIIQNVKLLPIKIGDITSVSFEAAIAGLDYLTEMKRLWISTGGVRGANVVVANGSFGGFDFPYNQDFDHAIARAGEQDILFVVASGNDFANNDPVQDFPSKFTLSLPNVIGVAATNADDELVGFSNRGTASVHVAAPGFEIESTWPEPLMVSGYNTISGTSMAAPMVAGILALQKSIAPNASAAQLKQALLEGVDVIPSLDGPHGLPLLVSTGGRVDAFKALQNIRNGFEKTDAITQGNWKPAYGTQGYAIPGEGQTLAANQVTVNNAEVVTVRAGRRPWALESIAGTAATPRVGSFYQADDFMDVIVNMGDAATHQLSLYFAELQGGRRTQRIEVFVRDPVDPVNAPLVKISERQVSKFARGEYVTFDLTGEVIVRISKIAGRNVVLNGIFVDAAAANTGSFQGMDTTTRGNWRANYDADGAYIVGYKDFSATEIVATPTNSEVVTIAPVTSRRGALLLEGETRRGSGSYLSTATSATLALSFTDGQPHQVTVYAVDLDRKRRAQRIELLDTGGNVIDQREISNFANGVYLTWEVTGDVTIRYTRLQGPNAVISGVFVDEQVGATGHFIGQDATTHGMWGGNYGLEGAFIVGDRDDTALPIREFNIPQTGGTVDVLSQNSRHRGAVQRYTSPTNRIAAQLETRDSMTLTLDLGVQINPQRVSFYATDYQRRRLAQRIEIFDFNNNLIAQTDMVNFVNGQYATFDLNGTVTVKITNLESNDQRAVLSAVYFD
ncbi:MAG TPA: S8 family peptidase [Tepidisphaeraceae bacterium]|jgi:subtilisin family serine protease|nr:S8 family peptidase [Tepidisphaeraceae bacterium]